MAATWPHGLGAGPRSRAAHLPSTVRWRRCNPQIRGTGTVPFHLENREARTLSSRAERDPMAVGCSPGTMRAGTSSVAKAQSVGLVPTRSDHAAGPDEISGPDGGPHHSEFLRHPQ